MESQSGEFENDPPKLNLATLTILQFNNYFNDDFNQKIDADELGPLIKYLSCYLGQKHGFHILKGYYYKFDDEVNLNLCTIDFWNNLTTKVYSDLWYFVVDGEYVPLTKNIELYTTVITKENILKIINYTHKKTAANDIVLLLKNSSVILYDEKWGKKLWVDWCHRNNIKNYIMTLWNNPANIDSIYEDPSEFLEKEIIKTLNLIDDDIKKMAEKSQIPLLNSIMNTPKLNIVGDKTLPASDKNNVSNLGKFLATDHYYAINYIQWFRSQSFKSTKLFLEDDDFNLILTNLSRVCAVLFTAGKPSYIIKESSEKPFQIVEKLCYDQYTCQLTSEITNKYGVGEGHKVTYLKPFADCFLQKIHEFNKIICQPYHIDDPPELEPFKFNIFQGFKAKIVEEPDYTKIEPLLNHIRVAWADGIEEIYRYVLSWMAHPLQNLTKSDVALFLSGPQGAGKTIMFAFLCMYVYGGNASLTVPDLASVMDKFNALHAGMLLTYVEETCCANRTEFIHDFNKFKPQITGNTVLIEHKGKDKYPVQNCTTYAITSNHDGIKVEKGDRHYICLECNDKYLNDTVYFNKIFAECFNQECGDIMYTYLRQYKSIPLTPVPATEYKKSLIQNGLPKHELFIQNCFVDQEIEFPGGLFYWDAKANKWYCSRQEFYDFYCSLLQEKPIKFEYFTKALLNNRFLTDAKQKRINKLQHRCFYIDPTLYGSIIIPSDMHDIGKETPNYLLSKDK